VLGLLYFTVGCLSGRPSASEFFADKGVRKLAEAAADGDRNEVTRLVKTGVNVNAAGAEGFTPLAYAMLSVSKKGFAALLDAGADGNAVVKGLPGGSGSIVALAAQADETFWLECLAEHKVDLDRKCLDGDETPLFFAVRGNKDKNLHFLLDHGANIERRSLGGWTPLQTASVLGAWQSAYVLLERGADWKQKLENGKSIVDLLAQYTRNPNMDRKNPLWAWRTKVLQWLYDHGEVIPLGLQRDITTKQATDAEVPK
jgi:ankyrin repeat protein